MVLESELLKSHDETLSGSVDLVDLFKNIDVLPPYFSLTNLFIDSDRVLSCGLNAELQLENEAGLIAAADVGRHLAILGSCVLSLQQSIKMKRYYLAHKAQLILLDQDYFRKSLAYPLKGEASVVELTEKEGKAATSLYVGNHKIYTLEVSYFILPEPFFKQAFAAKRVESFFNNNINPYTQLNALDIKLVDQGVLHALLGPFKPEDCAGHFYGYPAVPIAILMHCLSRCAGHLFKQMAFKDTYQVITADVMAKNLAFAGDAIYVTVSFLDTQDLCYRFDCLAKADDGRLLGQMVLGLK
jgi:hypothetical protein